MKSSFKYFSLFITLLFISHSLIAQTTGDFQSKATGNWSSVSSWQKYDGTMWQDATEYPGQSVVTDNTVSVLDGNEITLDISPAEAIGHLVVGSGVSGELNFNSTPLALILTGNITVNESATVDFYQTTTNYVTITINNTGASTTNTITSGGAPASIKFGEIVLNLGNTDSKLTCDQSITFGVITDVITYTGGTWEQTSGTLVFSGANSNQTITSTGKLVVSGDASITTGQDLIIQGSASILGTSNLQTGRNLDVNDAALEINTTGTITVGSTDAEFHLYGSGAANVVFTAGTLNISSRFYFIDGTFTMNGGTINVPSVGLSSSTGTHYVFRVSSTSADFDMAGGTVNILEANQDATFTNADVSIHGGAITGGKFVIGNGANLASEEDFVIDISRQIEGLTLNTNAAKAVLTNNNLDINGTFTYQSAASFLATPSTYAAAYTSVGALVHDLSSYNVTTASAEFPTTNAPFNWTVNGSSTSLDDNRTILGELTIGSGAGLFVSTTKHLALQNLVNNGTLKLATGAYLETTKNVGVPTNSNIANLGLELTSIVDLGSTVVRKYDDAQTLSTGTGVKHTYNILPTNNSSLNATLIFYYDEGSLNSIAETDLALWESADGTTWTMVSGSIADAAANKVTVTEVAVLSKYYTLGLAIPEYVSAKAINNTTIQVEFNCAIQTVTFGNFSSADFTVTGATVNGNYIDLTVDALNNTAFTSTDLDIAASAVTNSNSDANVEALNNSVTDGQVPVISSDVMVLNLNGSSPETITFNLNEASSLSDNADLFGWTVSNGTLASSVFNTTDQLITLTSNADGEWTSTTAVSYTQSSLSNVTDAAGNQLANISDHALLATTVSGTLNNASESAVVTGGETIIVTLSGGTWVSASSGTTFATSTAKTVISSITTAGGDWADVKTVLDANVDAANDAVVRTSDTEITITLPAVSAYDITSNEILSTSIPNSLVNEISTGNITGNDITIKILSAAVSGTLNNANSQDVVTGGETIIVTLSGGTWVSASSGTKFATSTAKTVISSITTAGGDWADVKTVLDANVDATNDAVVRTSDTEITITLPAVSAYSISSDEVLTIDLDHSVITEISSGTLLATPDITIKNLAVAFRGTLENAGELDVVAGGKNVVLTLTGGTWISASSGTKFETSIAKAIVASISGTGDWAAVQTVLDANADGTNDAIIRTSDSRVTINLPAVSNYDITADETLSINVSNTLVNEITDGAVTGNDITIFKFGVVATGTLDNTIENNVITGGETIVFTIEGGTWISATSGTQFESTIAKAIVSSISGSGDWAAVQTVLDANADGTNDAVVRTSDTEVTITLPSVAAYNITTNETLTISISNTLINEISKGTANTNDLTILSFEATLSGTLNNSAEQNVVIGGETIVVSLTGGTWVSATSGTQFDATTAKTIISSISSAGGSWSEIETVLNNNVDGANDAIVRTSDNLLTITLPAVVSYAISADEVLTIDLDHSVINEINTGTLLATPNITIKDLFVSLTGTVDNATESDVITGGNTIVMTLTGGTWVSAASGTQFDASTAKTIIASISTAGGDWADVKTELDANADAANGAVVRKSDIEVIITLPAVSSYDITADEILSLSVPQSLIVELNTGNLDATENLTITQNVLVTVTGTIQDATLNTESDIKAGGATIILTTDGEWIDADGIDPTYTSDYRSTTVNTLIQGLVNVSGDNQLAEIRTVLGASVSGGDNASIIRTSATVLTITLPAAPAYEIGADEQFEVQVPALMFKNSSILVTATPQLSIVADDAELTGTIVDGTKHKASDVAKGDLSTIIITLSHGTWAAYDGTTYLSTTIDPLFDGLAYVSGENKISEIITTLKAAVSGSDNTAVVRTSDKVLTITFPAAAGFTLDDDLVFSLTIPNALVDGITADVLATPEMTIIPTPPVITEATFDAANGQLTIFGTDFKAITGANNDITATRFTLQGANGDSYTLRYTPNVEIISATEATFTVETRDRAILNYLFNADGILTGTTTYYMSVTAGWNNGEGEAQANITPVTVSNYAVPTITSADYDASNGYLRLKGTNLANRPNDSDLDQTKITITGEADGTYILTTGWVGVVNTTRADIWLDGNDRQDRAFVNALLNNNGTTSFVNTTSYALALAADWCTVVPAGTTTATSGLAITLSNYSEPQITSATYDATSGVFVVQGANLASIKGSTDIDATKLSVSGEGTTALFGEAMVVTSDTEFTFIIPESDRPTVNAVLDFNGLVSSTGTTYDLNANENWNPVANRWKDWATAIPIDVTGVKPSITNVTYDASNGQLVLKGKNFQSIPGNDDMESTDFTISDGTKNYTLKSTPNIEISGIREAIFTVEGIDRAYLNGILNQDGTFGDLFVLNAVANWNGNDVPADDGNIITVSNYVKPKIQDAVYNVNTGILSVAGTGFAAYDAGRDIDVTKLTFKGLGDGAYTLTGVTDNVNVLDAFEFSIQLEDPDSAQVHALADRDGTIASDNYEYNLSAAEAWNPATSTAHEDLLSVVTVFGNSQPEIQSIIYDAANGQLTLTGVNFAETGAAFDVDVTKLTVSDGANSYIFTSVTPNVSTVSKTEIVVIVEEIDRANMNYLFTQDGTSGAGGTYGLDVAQDWNGTGSNASTSSVGITVSNWQVPQITSATYDITSGEMLVTGTHLVSNPGATGTNLDIEASKLMIRGLATDTRILTDGTNDVEVTSYNEFTLTIAGNDKMAVDALLNRNGLKATDDTPFELDALDGWNQVALVSADITDNNNPITVSGNPTPTLTSATYDSNSGELVLIGQYLISITGDDIIASNITVSEGAKSYTLVSSPNVEITSNTEATILIEGIDKAYLNWVFDGNGLGGTHNLSAAAGWNSSDAAENLTNPVDVSNFVRPSVLTSSYNANTRNLVVQGTNFAARVGGNDVRANYFTIRGKGDVEYTLTASTPNVNVTSDMEFTLEIGPTDKTQLDLILDRDGLTASEGSVYNLALADDWNVVNTTGIDETSNQLEVSGLTPPIISSTTYDAATGKLVFTGTAFQTTGNMDGSGNLYDIDATLLTITDGSNSYTLTSETPSVLITNETTATVTIQGLDLIYVNAILDKDGMSAVNTGTYDLDVADDWNGLGSFSYGNEVVSIDASNYAVPSIASATYNITTGEMILTGTRLAAKAVMSLDIGKFTFTGQTTIIEPIIATASDTSIVFNSESEVVITFAGTTKDNFLAVFDKSGTNASGGTLYNISTIAAWNPASANSAVVATVGVTVTGVAPILVAADPAIVDGTFEITFTDIDEEAWRNAITEITWGGNLIGSGAYDATQVGKIVFDPLQSIVLQTAGTNDLLVKATGFGDATVSQEIGAGQAAVLTITVEPQAPGTSGQALSVQPQIGFEDQYHNTTNALVNITASEKGGVWTIGGTTTIASTSLGAVYTDLTAFSNTANDVTIEFSSPGLVSVVSAPFTMPTPTVPPELTLATAATVDGVFTMNYTDADSWYASIPWTVKVGVTELTEGTHYTRTEGTPNTIVFDPATEAQLRAVGTLKMSVQAIGFSESLLDVVMNPGVVASVVIQEKPVGPAHNSEVLATQPIVKLLDQYENVCMTDNATTVIATKNDVNDWTLGGTATVIASAGIVTFTDLTGTNNTTAEITTAHLLFTESAGSQTVESGDFIIPAPESAPVASDVAIAGTTTVNEDLTGSYTYNDVNHNAEATSTYKWYRATDAAGTGAVEITGETATTYTLTADDLDKFVAFEVTPVADYAPMDGSPVVSAYVGAVAAHASPVLLASTVATVDAPFEITFTDDVFWRGQITAIKWGTDVLPAGAYDKTQAGKIIFDPAQTVFLQVPDTKDMTILAAGCSDAAVSQTIGVGVFDPAVSTLDVSPALALNTTSTATFAAKDKYGNPIASYAFAYYATVTNNNNCDDESYMIAGVEITSTVTNQALTKTDINGAVAIEIIMPAEQNPEDGISIQFNERYGTVNFKAVQELTEALASAIVLTADGTLNNVDNDIVLTFTSNATSKCWASNITSLTINGGTALVKNTDYIINGDLGTITLKPSEGNTDLQTAGNNKAIVIVSNGFADSNVSQTISHGAVANLAFATTNVPDSPANSGSVLATQPWVELTDQYSNACSDDNASQVVAAKADAANWALGGTTTITVVNGIGKFTDLTGTNNTDPITTITTARISFTITGVTPLESANLTIPAPEVAPIATAVSVGGTPTVNEVLTGNYTYSDANGDVEDVSIYKWYSATDATGTGASVISGAIATTYTLTAAEQDKFIAFEVQPITLTGTTDGTPVLSAYVGAVAAHTSPALLASTVATVDAPFEITFTDDVFWRGQITAIKWGTDVLPAGAYDKTQVGKIVFDPAQSVLLQTPATKDITIYGLGCTDAIVNQTVGVGAFVAANSSLVGPTPGLVTGTSSNVTLEAKDKYNNPIPNYVFTYDATITDDNTCDDEAYLIDGVSVFVTTTGQVVSVTDAAGQVIVPIVMPTAINPLDGIGIQFKEADGTTNFKTAMSYFEADAGVIPLTADITDNNVDNTIDISFTSSTMTQCWANNITSLYANGVLLTKNIDYTVNGISGTISLLPSGGSTDLQTAGIKTIRIESAGFMNTAVDQTINHGATASLAFATTNVPVAPTVSGGLFAPQPWVELTDQYGNACTDDNTSQIVAVKNDAGDWVAGGTLTVTIVNGVAKFTDLTATNNTKIEITNARMTFTLTGLTPLETIDLIIPVAEYEPEATDVLASGVAKVNEVLTGSYTYSDANNDVEGTTIYKWYRADDAAGTGIVQIAGANTTSYTLVEADLNSYITFEVTPIAVSGTLTGQSVKSNVIGPIDVAEEAPIATTLEVTGELYAGRTLSVTYVYSDQNDDAEATSVYQWYRADDVAGTNKTAIVGANALDYELAIADVAKYIAFEVTPKALTGTTDGVPVTSVFVGPIQDGYPKADFDYVLAAPAVLFQDYSINAETYFWDFGDGETSTEAEPVHVYETEGKFTVKLTVENQYGRDDMVKEIDISSTGIDDLNKESQRISVLPTPNDGRFDLIFANKVSIGDLKVEIYDIRGQLVRSNKFEVSDSQFREAFDMTEVKSGIYTIVLHTKEAVFTKRIIINK